MKRLLFISITATVIVGFVSLVTTYAKQTTEEVAQQAAEAWLGLTDSGKHAESWEEAAQLFKARMSKEKWIASLDSVRKPLGKIQSRKLKNARYTKSLPGAPEGEYVILEYESSFEKRKSAKETIFPTLDKDGKWRVSGYIIR